MDATNVLREIGCKPEYSELKNMLIIDREIMDVKKNIAGLYGRKKLLEEEKEKRWNAIVEKSRDGGRPVLEELDHIGQP